jgi:1,3-alpha-isomaltosidase
MIRHNPPGRGHRYRDSLDQRTPVQPVADEPVTLRVLADPGIDRLLVDVAASGSVNTVAMTRDAARDGSGAATGGHLAAAAQAGEDTGGLEPHVVRIGGFAAGQVVRYRFRDPASDRTSDWWSFVPARWQPDGGEVCVVGQPAGRLVVDSIQWLVIDPAEAAPDGSVVGTVRARVALRLGDSEHVVGLGERFHALDQRGWAVDAEVFEQYCSQGERTYLPVPFAHVIGGSGWGFHVDTTRRVWFDVGRRDPDLIWIETLVSPADPRVVLRLWEGSPSAVLAGFFERVGRPGLIPDWAYRPWISGNEWNTQARVEAEVARSLAEGVPVGVVVIEAWSDEGTIHIFRDARYQPTLDGSPHRLADFTFPADGAWPDPVGMVERLHAQGVRVLLWQIPVIPDHDLDEPQLLADRRALVDGRHAVQEADGTPYRNRGWWFPRALLPDFTSPATRRWWTEKRRYLLEEVGVDGFKTDGGEHAWGDELRFADGSRGDVTNNRYPNLYAQAFHELIASTGREAVTFSRSGHAGAGSFPAHWAGDEKSTWDAFRASVTAGLTAGASGVFAWGWDHGGFSGEIPEPELYLRTAAMACFCPIMQYHAEYNHHRQPSNDRTPWNIADRTGRPEVLSIYRRLAVLRERLVPYLVEQADRSRTEAKPLMRPMFFEWPTDRQIWSYPTQYLLGDDLLVSPVVAPGVERWPVYLPAGRWVDVWTGTEHPGEQVIDLPAPIEQIPVLVRGEVADRHLTRFADLPAITLGRWL